MSATNQTQTAASRWVLLHGFTQTHQSWWPTIRALCSPRDAETGDGSQSLGTRPFTPAERAVVGPLQMVDLPGHGSSAAPTQPGLASAAAELIDLAGVGTYVGYSLGGRLALSAAVLDASAAERRVERLVLISTTAGIEGDAERAERRSDDEALAGRIEAAGTKAFLDEWLAKPLFSTDSFEARQPPDRRSRDTNDAAGLAASLRCHGTGQMTPLWDRLSLVSVPTLIVTGERDTKFTKLGERLAAALPHSERHVIAGAGHSLPIECPGQLAEVIDDWDSRNPVPPARTIT